MNNRKNLRTPGEVAFDQCFRPIAFCMVVGTSYTAIIARLGLPDAVHQIFPFSRWIVFGIGIVLTILWCRALRSLIRGWNDPAASILRFVAVILLFVFALITCSFLQAPFR